MRKRYLVAYDVRDDSRLRKTYKKMLGFGDPVQYSVFLCDLSRSELVIMREALREILNLQEDCLLIAELPWKPGKRSHKIQVLGQRRLPEPKRCYVI